MTDWILLVLQHIQALFTMQTTARYTMAVLRVKFFASFSVKYQFLTNRTRNETKNCCAYFFYKAFPNIIGPQSFFSL